MSLREARARLEGVWYPYHGKLRELLDAALQSHGQAVLIDCHSMPREAVETVARAGARRPDVVLGDRFGAAASGDVVDRVEAAFRSEGFTVARNTPFAGAYICQHYGRPSRRQHVVQVEIDRGLYMDEKLIAPNTEFEAVAAALDRVVAQLAEIGEAQMPLAAE
jgi:N-formylglutamate deformylase